MAELRPSKSHRYIQDEKLALDLANLRAQRRWEELQEGCGGLPHVLGRTTQVAPRLAIELNVAGSSNQQCVDKRRGMSLSTTTPHIRRLSYISYERPSLANMRFFSIDPLDLDITSGSSQSASGVDRRDRLLLLSETLRGGQQCDMRKLIRQV